MRNGSFGNFKFVNKKEQVTYTNSRTTKLEKPIASTRNGYQKKDYTN